MVAAAQRRRWLADLEHRRLETAKLRTLCTYIAATMQLAEGADNVLLDDAAHLHLGTGTETPGGRPGTPTAPARAAMPAARIPFERLADAPPAVRPGQRARTPDGIRELPLDKLGSFLVGGM